MGYAGDPSSYSRQKFQEAYPELPLSKIKSHASDLVGQHFGRLVVLERDKSEEAREKEKKQHTQMYLCKCECGKITSIARGNLLRGQKSCGCSKYIDMANSQRKDMIGQSFGTLTVISLNEEETKRTGTSCYNCLCSKCNQIKVIRATNLRQGVTQGCSCEKMSHGERKISQILKELNINFLTQKTFQDYINKYNNSNFKMDFYLPDYNCCIEYNGIQHYTPVEFFGGEKEFKYRQDLDEQKRQYCLKHNIKYIVIPYTDYKELNKQYIQNKLKEVMEVKQWQKEK